MTKIQEINPKLGFLQGSVVCAYCTYTLLSAMMRYVLPLCPITPLEVI